jgi:hypothetical protein
MRGINRLVFFRIAGQGEQGARNFVLGVSRQAAHQFKGLFEQLGHKHSVGVRASGIKASVQKSAAPALARTGLLPDAFSGAGSAVPESWNLDVIG